MCNFQTCKCASYSCVSCSDNILSAPFFSHVSAVLFLVCNINLLNTELNPICHLLALLGAHPIFHISRIRVNITMKILTFMGPCIVRIFQYISNKMQRYTVYLYLETALHVSGGTTTHHQERKQLYLQHLVFVRPLLLPAAIAAGSSNGLTNTRCCGYSCLRS